MFLNRSIPRFGASTQCKDKLVELPNTFLSHQQRQWLLISLVFLEPKDGEPTEQPLENGHNHDGTLPVRAEEELVALAMTLWSH